MSTSGEVSSEDDDDELLMAASAWASAQDEESGANNEDNDDIPSPPKELEPINRKGGAVGSTDYVTSNKPVDVKIRGSYAPPQNNYSLHLKNVPFDASQGDIRFVFGEKGCNVTSVRLVYDCDQKTGERHFRGVAFVDLADEQSYKLGLDFHNKAFLGKGRRVNVRPTRTKSELSDIVRRTEEKVATLIARSKEVAQTKKRDRDDDTVPAGSGKSHKKQKRNKAKARESPTGLEKSHQAVTSAQNNTPEKMNNKEVAQTKKRGRRDDTSKLEVKDAGSGNSKKKQKSFKLQEVESPGRSKKSDQTAISPQSNVPENMMSSGKKSEKERCDTPNIEPPQSNHKDETTKTGSEETKDAKENVSGRRTSDSSRKHDAQTVASQNNDTIGASKGHNKKYGKGRAANGKHADSKNKNGARTAKSRGNRAKEKTKGTMRKGKKRSRSNDAQSPGNVADVKLTKKQRAKKAAVIRMMKLKG